MQEEGIGMILFYILHRVKLPTILMLKQFSLQLLEAGTASRFNIPILYITEDGGGGGGGGRERNPKPKPLKILKR